MEDLKKQGVHAEREYGGNNEARNKHGQADISEHVCDLLLFSLGSVLSKRYVIGVAGAYFSVSALRTVVSADSAISLDGHVGRWITWRQWV